MTAGFYFIYFIFAVVGKLRPSLELLLIFFFRYPMDLRYAGKFTMEDEKLHVGALTNSCT